MGLVGLFGRPFVDLSDRVDGAALDAVDDEITRGLAEVAVDHTGGTLKWMGVVAPFQADDPFVDAMHAIERMSRDELARFVALGERPGDVDLDGPRRFGDETEHPFTRAQVAFLKYRHDVYFPWKVCYHLLENDRWEDKHEGAGKDFGDEAKAVFPETVALVRSLPFEQIGRCVIFGMEANDHAPFHRDTEPGALSIAQSISLDPRGNKRFALSDADGGSRVIVDARAYWFNDMDFHGVLADPFFRYSIRVDGVFTSTFARELRARFR